MCSCSCEEIRQLKKLRREVQALKENIVGVFEDALQGWVSYAEELKAQLAAALETAQQLRDTDVVEDAAQAEALTNQLAAQLSAALETAKNPPEDPEA